MSQTDRLSVFVLCGILQCKCCFGQVSSPDHFRSALDCVHKDLIVLKIPFFQIHRSIPDFAIRLACILQQKLLIKVIIILTIHQTDRSIHSERFDLRKLFFPGGLPAVILRRFGNTVCAFRAAVPV